MIGKLQLTALLQWHFFQPRSPGSELHIKHVIVAGRSLQEEMWLVASLGEVSSLAMIGEVDRILTLNQQRQYNGQISSNSYVWAGTGGSESKHGDQCIRTACLNHPIRTEEKSKAESHQED